MVVTFDFDDTLLELAVKRDAEGDIEDVHVTNREKNPRTWPRFLKFLDAQYDVHIVTSRNENGKRVEQMSNTSYENGESLIDLQESISQMAI